MSEWSEYVREKETHKHWLYNMDICEKVALK